MQIPTIFVVDDVDARRATLRSQLEAAGFRVEIAATVEEARGRAEGPALILHNPDPAHGEEAAFPAGCGAPGEGAGVPVLRLRAASTGSDESEARFRATFEQAAVGMAHVAMDGRLLRVNPKLCELLGYEPEEIMKLRAKDLRHAEDVAAAAEHVEALRARVIRSSTSEERCLRKDGSRIWAAVTRSLAHDAAGTPLYVVEVLNEIERRKRAEEARERALASERAARLRIELAEAQMARLQRITSELSRALTPGQVAEVVLTQGLAALYADAGYVALPGEDRGVELLLAPGYPEEILERYRRCSPATPLPSTDCIRTGRLLVFESPEAMAAAYPDLPSQGWAKTWVYVPMALGGRTIGALCITYRDTCRITEDDRRFMNTLAQQGAQAIERARLYEAEQRARRLREEALAIAAHDLRNPLSSIMMSAAIIEKASADGDSGQRVRERAEKIQRAAQRTAEMLRELLDAATIDAKSLKLELAPCEVDTLLAEVIEMLSPIAEQKRIELAAHPLGAALQIRCDRGRLIQVLSNLVGNACKFTPEGGRIAVRAELDGGSVRFSVSDTGLGINPEHIPRLFERYWQARSTQSTGTGLGLYIVKGIVEAHSGRISVSSKLGVGTTFWFDIPAGW